MHAATGHQALGGEPSFSIVICTDGRVGALRNTLCSLGFLDYDHFEVCVVCGPTNDGTRELLGEYTGRIKVAYNPERNLSISRNIGIALAGGEIVAFIDDDCIPEPEWLRDLAASYNDSIVGGVGGFVYNHLGTGFQCRFTTVDRFARPKFDYVGPVDQMCFPLTTNIPHMLGTNSSFRRSALLSISGFDEEYDYFLDETDVIVRLADAGWSLRIIEGAYVHHKFLPSTMRHMKADRRVLSQWYSVVKNKIYFALRHAIGHFSFNDVIDDSRQFINELSQDMLWAVTNGMLDESDRTRFWVEVDQAWHDGLQHGLSEKTRLITKETLEKWCADFLPFSMVVPQGGRRTFCFVTQEYTLGQMGGIGRYTHELADSISAMGHHVHVIARDGDYDRIDFDRGVWLHRVTDKVADTPQPAGLRMPAHVWNRAMTVSHTVDDIATKRQITAVCAPIWDCEGIGVLADGRHPLVTTLQTSMVPFLASNPTRASDYAFVRDYARPMIEAETLVMRESQRVIACTHAILDEMDKMYGVQFDPERLSLIPYGIGDWSDLAQEAPEALPPESVRLLFVGRLEERKGIDVLLNCAKRVLVRHPHVYLDLVGNDFIPGPQGQTFREIFEADPDSKAVRDRVMFHGAASDEKLRGYYRACDVVVAPSRFESFGLMLVEAMIFGKPVIACNTGGMPEVAENGVTGLLAEPGDESSLEACIERLIADSELRARMGTAARARYEKLFHTDRIAAAIVASFIVTADSVALPVAAKPARQSSIGAQPAEVQRELAQIASASSKPERRRVVIVAPMLARYDAISVAVRDTYRMLSADQDLDVVVLTPRNDFLDVKAQKVGGLNELLDHPTFLAADLIIYHFGIFSEFFNVLICGNGHALQVVRFHNITPIEFVMPSQVQIVGESFRQISNLTYADEIWADSQVNKDVLEEYGIRSDCIGVLPLVVDEPSMALTSVKGTERLEVLFMGRCVPSKGLFDLVKAVDLARCHSPLPIRLRIAGSEEWSDQEYLASVKLYVSHHHLEEIIEFCGAVDDTQKERLYHEAHVLAIPSYHEGFCKPVIEGLRSGCVPVGYASYNLPPITNGLGRLVPPGDIEALAAALADVLGGISEAIRAPHALVLPLDRGIVALREFDSARSEYVKMFTFENVAKATVQRVRTLLARADAVHNTEEDIKALSGAYSSVSSALVR